MNARLDKLERNIVKELEDKRAYLIKTIESEKSTLTRMKLSIDKDIKTLEDVKRSDRIEKMFVCIVNISKALTAYDSVLSELVEKKVNIDIVFERNEEVCNFLEEIQNLGFLHSSENKHAADDHIRTEIRKENNQVDLSSLVIEDDTRTEEGAHLNTTKYKAPVGTIPVKLIDDIHTPMITGIEIVSDNHFVLCNHRNTRIKLFDSTGKFRGNLNLEAPPWDVAAIDDNLVVVTLPGIKQVQRIELFPKLRSLRHWQLDESCYSCYGIAVIHSMS